MIQTRALVIGGGVIGLSVSNSLSKSGSCILVEKLSSLGQVTTARNSSVIHNGVYYPIGSLKQKLCIKGRTLLYPFLSKFQIPFKKCGKWIIATSADQLDYLSSLYNKGTNIGIPLSFVSTDRQVVEEPNLNHKNILGVLESPETGIMDVHEYVSVLEYLFRANDGDISLNSNVTAVEYTNGRYITTVQVNTPDSPTSTFQIESEIVVNAAGLQADQISKMLDANLHKSTYNVEFVKGHYMKYSSSKPIVKRLLYPCPPDPKAIVSLGIHATLDLDGQLKFGPDIHKLKDKREDYSMDTLTQEKIDLFHSSINQYINGIDKSKLHPDYSGIRPKLSSIEFRDFVIKEESDNGYPGFVNLLGIESPGLTSSLAIAEYVQEKLGI